MLALLALGWLGMGAGCYSTTPHRAQVATRATVHECADAVTDVFSRSGFIQLPTPRNLSMFFSARMSGPYDSFLRTGAGVGVTLSQEAGTTGLCHVTIEALSPDANCADEHVPMMCNSASFGLTSMSANTGSTIGGTGIAEVQTAPCPIVRPLMCDLSYAPGSDGDVDELARRVQAVLGSRGRVN
ncbi:MAG TPA: hypothetical protein VMT47_11110 [Polyangia bacterium]|nr:hypothetical protein [Polyangia bacterium]